MNVFDGDEKEVEEKEDDHKTRRRCLKLSIRACTTKSSKYLRLRVSTVLSVLLPLPVVTLAPDAVAYLTRPPSDAMPCHVARPPRLARRSWRRQL